MKFIDNIWVINKNYQFELFNHAFVSFYSYLLILHENTNLCMLCPLVCAQLAEEKSKKSAATSSDKENKDDSFKIKKKCVAKLPIKEVKIEDHCSPKLDLDTPVDCFSTPNVVKRIKRCTSTPSTVTPHQQHPNDDMSPITQSAQKMTKSMQVFKMCFFICTNTNVCFFKLTSVKLCKFVFKYHVNQFKLSIPNFFRKP